MVDSTIRGLRGAGAILDGDADLCALVGRGGSDEVSAAAVDGDKADVRPAAALALEHVSSAAGDCRTRTSRDGSDVELTRGIGDRPDPPSDGST